VINSKNKEKLHTSRRPDTSKCNTMRYKEYGTQKVRGVGEDKARKREVKTGTTRTRKKCLRAG
jgi:hypothetical protein